jgi:hypothetical protein
MKNLAPLLEIKNTLVKSKIPVSIYTTIFGFTIVMPINKEIFTTCKKYNMY